MYSERPAKFSGSWYDLDPSILRNKIEKWLREAEDTDILDKIDDPTKVKALLVPHAGHRFSGPTASFSYALLRKIQPKRIILVGPSHRGGMGSSLGRTRYDELVTPLGNIVVEKNLFVNKAIDLLEPSVDMGEHSLEMQLPFIKYCCPDTRVFPVLVSRVQNDCNLFIESLTEILKSDPDTILIISSDFCHWGEAYGYYPNLSQSTGQPFSEAIRSLDIEGFTAITQGYRPFKEYLSTTCNTICGREPISLALKTFEAAGFEGKWSLLDYSQSSFIQTYSPRNCSVSYVAAVYSI